MAWTSARVSPPTAPALAVIKSPSGTWPGLATGPTTYAPVNEPGLTPAGSVVWATKGSDTPSITTTPGGAGLAPNPAFTAPENAANSATAGGAPATPTPPTRRPFLNKGTPPGLTALGFESLTSALPV